MRRFRQGQRVHVIKTDVGILIDAPGTVVRLRHADDGAWVALDVLSSNDSAHPFDRDDPRGTHVLAYPEDCEALRAAREVSKRRSAVACAKAMRDVFTREES